MGARRHGGLTGSGRAALASAFLAATLHAGPVRAQVSEPARFDEIRMVQAYVAHGAPREALDYIDSVLPQVADPLLRRDLCMEKARLLRTQGRMEQALAAVRQGEHEDLATGEQAGLQLMAGSVLESLDKTEEAQAAYRTAWRDAGDPWVANAAGRQLLRRLTAESADELAAWAGASGAPQERVLRLLGSLYLATDRPQQAAEAWRARLELPPWDDEVYQRLVQHYRARSDFQGWISAAELRWKQLDGSNLRHDALQDILLAHREAGDLEAAVEHWRQQGAAGDLLATRLLGEHLWATPGGSQEALALDRRLLAADPNDARAYTRSARTLQEAQRWQDLAELTLSISQACDQPNQVLSAGQNLSMALRRSAGLDQARERLEDLRRTRPHDAVVRHALAALLEDLHVPAVDRLPVLEETAAILPQDPTAQRNVVQILMSQGQYDTVLGRLADVEQHLPDESDWIRPARLTALLRLGRPQDALAAVHETLSRAESPAATAADAIQAHELTLMLYIAETHGEAADLARVRAMRDLQFVFPRARVEQEFMNALTGRELGDADYTRKALARAEALVPRSEWPESIRNSVESLLDRWLESPPERE